MVESNNVLHVYEIQMYIQASFYDQVFWRSLEAMDVQLLFLGQTNIFKEFTDICTLIPLQLYHLSILWVVNDCAITTKLLQRKNNSM